MAQTVEQIAEEILRREGGYVNDPSDPGGATNFGVTIHTMRRLGMDLDGDGDVDAQDVRKLSMSQAKEIFLKHYFYGPNIHLLPKELQASVFDMQVNAGANAIKILQRLCGRMGYPTTVDGALGPNTAAVVKKAWGPHFVDAYGIERRNYYFRLADRRPASRKYARTRAGGKGGWIKRAEEFISPRYHMTDAEFRARVAAWA